VRGPPSALAEICILAQATQADQNSNDIYV
jgi:hypothetical protein